MAVITDNGPNLFAGSGTVTVPATGRYQAAGSFTGYGRTTFRFVAEDDFWFDTVTNWLGTVGPSAPPFPPPDDDDQAPVLQYGQVRGPSSPPQVGGKGPSY